MEEKETKLRIRELVEKREKLWGKVKKELTPLMLKLIKDAEKIKGYIGYWDLCDKLADEFGLAIIDIDYLRITRELEGQGLIKKQWSAGIGGFLTTRN